MPASPSRSTPWWGSYTFEEDQAGRWIVGPSTVWIRRTPQEWRLIHSLSDDPLAGAADVTLPVDTAALEEARAAAAPDEIIRYTFQQTAPDLRVVPTLPDRAVVVHPETPLYVPAGETVRLYVSVALWLRFEVGEPSNLLREAPSFRLSDTWFGHNTREGELCYATQTSGRLRLDDVPLRLHRVVIPVDVRNHASDILLLERIRLPVHYLTLYEGANHFLWTQTVTFRREGTGDLAEVKMGEGAPPEAPGATLLRPPRQTTRGSIIARTFSTLLHI